jgi:hypothetical protein
MNASYWSRVHRAVEIGGALGLGLALVVALCIQALRQVDRCRNRRWARWRRRRPARLAGAARISAASAGEVSGPVAMIHCPVFGQVGHFLGGDLDVRVGLQTRGDVSANGSRSTASAPPAGRRWASAVDMISPPAGASPSAAGPRRSVSSSSERNELEQTISPVAGLCASVPTSGRISWITTVGRPRRPAMRPRIRPCRRRRYAVSGSSGPDTALGVRVQSGHCVHSGGRFSMKAAIPSSVSRNSMFCTITSPA